MTIRVGKNNVTTPRPVVCAANGESITIKLEKKRNLPADSWVYLIPSSSTDRWIYAQGLTGTEITIPVPGPGDVPPGSSYKFDVYTSAGPCLDPMIQIDE